MGWDWYAIRRSINMFASPCNSQAIMNKIGKTLSSIAPWKKLVLCFDELLYSSSLTIIKFPLWFHSPVLHGMYLAVRL